PKTDPFELAGGVGLGLDLAGDDKYESSNFAEACGYFYGTRLLLGFAGKDEHVAARDGLAAGADPGGGPVLYYPRAGPYSSTGPTYNGGCAWDRSAFLFIDAAGDDRYDLERSYGFGRGDHGSWGVFADLAGKDRYAGTNFGQADEKSLGLFLDAGGADDY